MDKDNNPSLGIVTSGEPKSPGPNKKRLVLSLLVAVVVSLGLGLILATRQRDNTPITSTPAAQTTATAEVSITANSFEPATLTVKVGTKVTWTNQEDLEHWVASNPYPANTDLPGLNAGKKMVKGDTYSYTFDKAGTYNYHDDLSPTTNGTVIVEE